MFFYIAGHKILAEEAIYNHENILFVLQGNQTTVQLTVITFAITLSGINCQLEATHPLLTVVILTPAGVCDFVLHYYNNKFFIADNCPYTYIKKTFKIQTYLYK